jgi:23S rRNA pseudouridine2457 synthase
MSQGHRYFVIYKPFGVITKFTNNENELGFNLSHYGSLPKDVYPIGRLDKDSEGLLLLSNDKKLNNRFLNPTFSHARYLSFFFRNTRYFNHFFVFLDILEIEDRSQ